jgi:MYXO-CTERM domain-containing protein
MGSKLHRRATCAAALVTASVLCAPAAHGVVVWSDDLAGQSDGSFPFRDFTGNSANDYVQSGSGAGTYQVTTAVGNAQPGIALVDPDGTANPTLAVSSAQWTAPNLSASNNLLTAKFDFRVEDFNSGAAENSNPRFIFRHTNAANTQIIIAFGRTTTAHIDDGPAGGDSDLAMVAHVATSGTSLVVPSNANAIGLNQGSGWAPGFDFGNYDPDTSLNDTNDQFYHVEVTYDFVTGGVTGSATNVSTGESATFARTMNAGLTFTNAASAIQLSSFSPNTTVSYFDNLEVSVTPEPSGALALLVGAGALAARQRRRTL